MNSDRKHPARPRRLLEPGRIAVYAFLASASVFFLLPLYVMLVTSFKSVAEIRQGAIFALPQMLDLSAWGEAWSKACTGLSCNGIRGGFWNSIAIVVPSTVLSILIGAVNGYALALWRVRKFEWMFGVLMLASFIPYQVLMYPLVRGVASIGLFGTLPAIVLVHTIFGMPVMTLLFRNYYASLPVELFKAARIDGGGFWRIFLQLMLPMSLPILVVAIIMQTTGIWNDFILGLVFAGRANQPMTVELSNITFTSFGEVKYNVNMAATILTSMVPLAIYFVSGRWFVRGIAAGAVKG
jgi:glucose/mannose transport system permease protein